MNNGFLLSCESTVDLPYSYVAGRDIPVLFYTYMVDGAVFPDDMGRDPAALPRFYEQLAGGKLPSTSQLNEFQYEAFFEPLLQQGDVLHIAFDSGMTGSVANARKAEALVEKHPDRTIRVVDSLCSSSGYGLLVDVAATSSPMTRCMARKRLWSGRWKPWPSSSWEMSGPLTPTENNHCGHPSGCPQYLRLRNGEASAKTSGCERAGFVL